MAVVHDATGTKNWVAASTTWTHVTGSGDNRILIVAFGFNAAVNATNVTYNGEALTYAYANSNAAIHLYVWYLLNPPIGSFTMSCTSPNTRCTAVSNTWTGVDTTDPFGTEGYDDGTGAVTVDVTAQEGWLVVDAIADQSDSAVGTEGANQTKRGEIRQGGASGAQTAVCHMTEEAGAITVTMSYTFYSGWSNGTQVAMPLKPYIPFIARPIEYTIDIFDPEQRILDSSGHIVPRYKIKPNNWVRTIGLDSPTAEAYENNYDDPTLAYIESVKYDGETDQVEILTNRGDFPEVIMERLAAGNTG